jgi:hypothetical protein
MARLFADRAQAEREQFGDDVPPPPEDIDLRQVRLSIEARKRYFERFYGPLPQVQADSRNADSCTGEELRSSAIELRQRMQRSGRVQFTAPPWVGMRTQAGKRVQGCVAYVVINEEIALPLVWDRNNRGRLIAVTCLWVPPREREDSLGS